MTPMLTNYTTGISYQTPTSANAMAYAGIKTFGGFTGPVPRMRQYRHRAQTSQPAQYRSNGSTSLLSSAQEAWKTAADWASSFFLPGADAATTKSPKPALSVGDLVKENRGDFQIRMGFDVDRNGDLLGHVVTVGIDGMPFAYKAQKMIDSLDFDRGDIVLVEGFDSHCSTWQEFGIPKDHCVPLDTEAPDMVHKLQKAEGNYLEAIKSTADKIFDHLPSNFFGRFGYQFDLTEMHVNQLLDFISAYESRVKPESRALIQTQMAKLTEAGQRFEATRKEVAITRQTHMANTATMLKRPGRIVVMMTDCSNAAGIAQRMYQQNDIVMVDAVAANTKPSARLPQPKRDRTDL